MQQKKTMVKQSHDQTSVKCDSEQTRIYKLIRVEKSQVNIS